MADLPDFMVRVKLPNPNAFHGGPSGDTDYETAYQKALSDACPDGFAYIFPRSGETWPRDSEGYTYLRLRCTAPGQVLADYAEEVKELRAKLKLIRKAVSNA